MKAGIGFLTLGLSGALFAQEATPVVGNPAEELGIELGDRIVALKKKADGLNVDVTVLAAEESLEAKLKLARAEASVKQIEGEVKDLEKAKRYAALAAKSLEVCSDKARVEKIFADLGERAAKAKTEVEAYQRDRKNRIEVVKAQTPVQAAVVPLDVEATVILGTVLDSMGGVRRANFLSMVYAVAAELNVRVPQEIEGRSPVYNHYASVLNRSPRSEMQMALLTLVAYSNRQKNGLGGTLLGKPIEELSKSRAVGAGTGRGYTISPAALDAYLLREVKQIWGNSDMVIGEWDLTKRQKTADAMKLFSVGDEELPDGELLGLLGDVREAIENHARGRAIVKEVDRIHSESLVEAKRYDAGLEKKAGVLFQAESLQKRQPARLETIAKGQAFFQRELERLRDDSKAPRGDEIRRHANALNDAAIGVGRAETMVRMLAEG